MIWVEWIDMPGGSRRAVDGPFEWVTFTYGDIRVGDDMKGEDNYIGGDYFNERGGRGWIREGDETEGMVGDLMVLGWYSDVSITSEDPT